LEFSRFIGIALIDFAFFFFFFDPIPFPFPFFLPSPPTDR